jgi:hypothetical protein
MSTHSSGDGEPEVVGAESEVHFDLGGGGGGG